jgi:hypothetical protein
MQKELVTLDELIGHVLAQHPEDGPLEHLSDAMLVSQRLGELADHLIGHFVDQARRAGAPWSAIGEAMGVSKQAAQKRFVPSAHGPDAADGTLNRFTPRARGVFAAARGEALAASRRHIGTEHVVLGLMSEPEGLAARAITALGASEEQLRNLLGAGHRAAPVKPSQPVEEQLRGLLGASAGAKPGKSPHGIDLDLRTKRSMGLALREALGFGHNYIGTEHLLLGILAEEKNTGAKVLTRLGVTQQRARDWLAAALEEIMTARERAAEPTAAGTASAGPATAGTASAGPATAGTATAAATPATEPTPAAEPTPVAEPAAEGGIEPQSGT